MSNEFASKPKPRPRWRDGLVKPRPAPSDFEAKFIEIGRSECETHYRVGRFVITHWLDQCGKERLLRLRAEHVTKHGEESCRAVIRYGRETVDQWRKEAGLGLNRADMARVLQQAFPVDDPRVVNPELASAAANFLRISRNGGFRISPTGDGDWWVGLRRRSSAEIVDMAKERGFEVPNVTGEGS